MFLTAASESRSDPENQIVLICVQIIQSLFKKKLDQMIYWICFNSVIWLQKTWNIAQVALDAYVVPLYYFLSLSLMYCSEKSKQFNSWIVLWKISRF